ncbi:MAG: NAD(P)-dependent oxidoreductase [Candidatus Omnitrophota bacterium]
MRLVVTGGAGFLGYHLCRQLADKYESIAVLDIAPIDPQEYPAHAIYYNVDVRDRKQLEGVLRKGDVIVHAAAALPLWKRKEIFEINVTGTKNILETALTLQIRKVIFVSSTAVYGIPKTHPLYENSALVGVGPYGSSKIEAELICQEYRQKGMCIPIVRPKSFIGPGRLGVFQILYDWIESGKRIPIIGNGKNRYQLLEVEDLADAIYLLLVAPEEQVNDVFNIGAAEFRTVEEDVGALCNYAHTGSRVMCTPARGVKMLLAIFEKLKISPLYKWIYATADKDSFVCVDKIKTIAGWAPKYSNKEALIKSYQWYLEHKNELHTTGITHRVAWHQGILAFAKRFL